MIIAWHGDAVLKEEVLARLREHRQADTIVQDLYQQYDRTSAMRYRGCAIGCILPLQGTWFGPRPYAVGTPIGGWHGRVEKLYGIPRAVGHLIDRIFEGLELSKAGDFAVSVIEAIPVSADLSLVTSRMMLDLLADDEHGVRWYTIAGSQERAIVDLVAESYRRRLAGDEPSATEWTTITEVAEKAIREADDTRDAAYQVRADIIYAAHQAAFAGGPTRDDQEATGEATGAAVDYASYVTANERWYAQRLIQHLTDALVPIAP